MKKIMMTCCRERKLINVSIANISMTSHDVYGFFYFCLHLNNGIYLQFNLTVMILNNIRLIVGSRITAS